MNFEARIEPLDGRLPKVSYHWDPETDILSVACKGAGKARGLNGTVDLEGNDGSFVVIDVAGGCRSEEHTSELQSRLHLVCRLLLEKKKKRKDKANEPHDGA